MGKNWRGHQEVIPRMQNVMENCRTPVGGVSRLLNTPPEGTSHSKEKVPGHEEWIALMRDRETQGLDLWTGVPLDDLNKKR